MKINNYFPNIIKLIEVLKTSNNYYIVYEYCNGGTLEEKIKKDKFIPEKQVKILNRL